MTETTGAEPKAAAWMPPRWLIRLIWRMHRAILLASGGRVGLRAPEAARWGTLRLRSVGRRTGHERLAILGYIEDGATLVIPAMNGWGDADPAWWLNLQASPAATVELPDGTTRAITARAASPEERERLWRRLVDLGTAAYTDAHEARRGRPTPIAILDPRTDR